jgi:hypothetical protein
MGFTWAWDVEAPLAPINVRHLTTLWQQNCKNCVAFFENIDI